MAFTTSNPVERDGKVYDKIGVSLITSPNFQPGGVGARIVLLLEPYRITAEGAVERPMVTVDGVTVVDTSVNRSVNMGDAFAEAASDADVAAALGAISAALQTFITAKGL